MPILNHLNDLPDDDGPPRRKEPEFIARSTAGRRFTLDALREQIEAQFEAETAGRLLLEGVGHSDELDAFVGVHLLDDGAAAAAPRPDQGHPDHVAALGVGRPGEIEAADQCRRRHRRRGTLQEVPA